MVVMTEQVRGANLRLFKWNVEGLFSEAAFEYGLFMFLIANEIIIKKFNPPQINKNNFGGSSSIAGAQEEAKSKNITSVQAFKLTHLLSRDTIELLLPAVTKSTGLFFEESIQGLSQKLSAHILTNFRFTHESLLGPTRSRIVFVVDVNVQRILDFSDDNIPKYRLMNEENSDEEEIGDETKEDKPFLTSYMNQMLTENDEKYEDKEDNIQLEEGVKEVASELMSFLIGTPEFLIRETKPNMSVHFRDLKQVKPPVITRKLDQGELYMCSICRDRILPVTVIAQLRCMHVFHKACMHEWVLGSNSCPLCGLACATFV